MSKKIPGHLKRKPNNYGTTKYHRFGKAGVRIAKKPQETFWGGYHADFKDVDGYLREVAWYPYMWIE